MLTAKLQNGQRRANFFINQKNMIGIYSITNRLTGEIYIGCSINIQERWNNHRSNLKKNRHENKHLQAVYNKYGDVFDYSIIEECSIENLHEREIFYIQKFDSIKNGYNQTAGGDGLVHPSDELKQRLHQSAVDREIWKQFPNTSGQNNPNYGKHPSEETRRKMSEKAKNRKRKPHSEETKQKMREAMQRRLASGEKFPGNHHVRTQEERDKIGKANSRKVVASTGEVFDSIKMAEEWSHGPNISSCCTGKLKTSGKHPETGEKLSWKYFEG